MNWLAYSIVTLLILLVIRYRLRKEKVAEQEAFENFIYRKDGRNFFCYNNRENSLDFIENKLLPLLPADKFDYVYLDGKEVVSEFSHVYMSKMLYEFKKYNRFPHLFKIRNGEIIELSINNAFYNVLNQQKPIEGIVKTINEFFEIDTIV